MGKLVKYMLPLVLTLIVGAEGSEFKVLRTLEWTPGHCLTEAVVFENQDALRDCWMRDGGIESEIPKIDFEHEMVLAVFGGIGTKGTVRIDSASDNVAGVKYSIAESKSLFEELTSASVIVVPRTNQKLEFTCVGRWDVKPFAWEFTRF